VDVQKGRMGSTGNNHRGYINENSKHCFFLIDGGEISFLEEWGGGCFVFRTHYRLLQKLAICKICPSLLEIPRHLFVVCDQFPGPYSLQVFFHGIGRLVDPLPDCRCSWWRRRWVPSLH
jgi:hypothetical protein